LTNKHRRRITNYLKNAVLIPKEEIWIDNKLKGMFVLISFSNIICRSHKSIVWLFDVLPCES
jgi:hypothetical protein